jgi:hypothetical protein
MSFLPFGKKPVFYVDRELAFFAAHKYFPQGKQVRRLWQI